MKVISMSHYYPISAPLVPADGEQRAAGRAAGARASGRAGGHAGAAPAGRGQAPQADARRAGEAIDCNADCTESVGHLVRRRVRLQMHH